MVRGLEAIDSNVEASTRHLSEFAADGEPASLAKACERLEAAADEFSVLEESLTAMGDDFDHRMAARSVQLAGVDMKRSTAACWRALTLLPDDPAMAGVAIRAMGEYLREAGEWWDSESIMYVLNGGEPSQGES